MPRKKRADGTRAPNNTNSIYQGKDGYWHGRVTMGIREDGTPDRRHVQSKDEGTVRRKVRELENARDAGTVRKPGRAWTLEKWLTHWVENIAAGSVRRTTMVGYRTSVYKHLIPGIGAHRLDKLEPEHLERLYRRMVDSGLKPATAHLAHRTVRVALNQAVRRKHITTNPATVAKPPRVVEDEIVPFTMDEARQILDTAESVRNGARFVIALTLGLRRGEALGIKWSDLDIQWQHGCARGDDCRTKPAQLCSHRHVVKATLTIRRAVQQYIWQHGCSPDKPCGHKYGARCPQRHGGGVVTTEVKSRAGQRTIGLPLPLIRALERHRERQAVERARAGNLWHDEGWAFTNHIGKPVHPTVDHDMWKALLKRACVRDARLHDARHTAATMLLVLKVPLPAVMEIMGWSDAAVAKRYMHVPNELVAVIAQQVTDLVWTVTDSDPGDETNPVSDCLTADQLNAVRRLADALPETWRQRLTRLLDEGDDGAAGTLVPA